MVNMIKKLKEKIFSHDGLVQISISHILGSAITSIFWFYLASIMEPEEYGEIFFLIGIAAMAFNFSNIGSENTQVVLSAKGRKLEPTLNTISLIIGVVSSLIMIIIFSEINITILIFGYIINTLSLGYLIGVKLYRQYSIFLLTQKILTVTLGISFFYYFGVDGVIPALGISYLGFIIIIVKLYRKDSINFKEFKRNFNFIWQNYLLKIVGGVRDNLDKLIIVPILGFTFLGNYALAAQFIAVLSLPNLIFFQYILTNDAVKIKNKKLKKYFLLVNVGIVILAITLLPVVIREVFPQFSEITEIIGIMSISLIFSTIVSIKISELLADEKSKPVLIGGIISGIVVSLGIIILGSLYGIYGVAISFVLTTAVHAIFLSLWVRKNN